MGFNNLAYISKLEKTLSLDVGGSFNMATGTDVVV